jgi:hypothetical protein
VKEPPTKHPISPGLRRKDGKYRHSGRTPVGREIDALTITKGIRRAMPESNHEAAVAEFIRKWGITAMPDRVRLAYSRLDCSSR